VLKKWGYDSLVTAMDALFVTPTEMATYTETTQDYLKTSELAGAETDPIVGAITGIPKADGAGNISTAVADTDYDSSISNEVNTIQGDDNGATSGLAISIDGAGIVTTDVVGDVMTITGTEVDGSTTNEINTITCPDANVTAGLGITFADTGLVTITEAADTITFDVTGTKANFDTAVTDGTITFDGDAPTAHAASHAVGAADTTFPADPDADKYLMWDDDPGNLSWENSAGNVVDTLAATLGAGADGNAVAQTNLGKLSGVDAGVYLDMSGDGAIDLTSDGTLELHSNDWDISTTGVGTDFSFSAADNVIEADTVTNATLTTALTVNTGTVEIKGAGANTSVLTLAAGASSVGGANTGDNTVCTSGTATTAANLSGTPALPNGTTATTQSASDGSTKLATCKYADDAAGGGVAVSLNASATTGGMSISTQEISNRAATNAQTGYATAAQITALELNTAKLTFGTDPDVATDGYLGVDTDDDSIRGTSDSGTTQFVYGERIKWFTVTITKPLDLDEADNLVVMWNKSPFSFVITVVDSESEIDCDYTLLEMDDRTDFTDTTEMEEYEIDTAGTGVYTDTDATSYMIETGHGIAFNNDAADDPDSITFTVSGYFNGDVD